MMARAVLGFIACAVVLAHALPAMAQEGGLETLLADIIELEALGIEDGPPMPTQRPESQRDYEQLQAEIQLQDQLIQMVSQERPAAPERDENFVVPSETPILERAREADPVYGPEGVPFPYPDYRPNQPPIHTILKDADEPEGNLTVRSDGSRSVVASNVKLPSSQKLPAVDPNCPARLRALGVEFTPLPDFRKESGCQNIGVLKVTNFGSGVSLNPSIDVTCQVAEGMALWLRNSVQSEAMRYFGRRVVKLSNTHGYSCRFRSGGKVSEHGFANAIDIGTFHLADGRTVRVLDHWPVDGTPFGINASRWLKRLNDSACDYFQLVLNPRSNKAHENHFHFDQGRWKSCD